MSAEEAEPPSRRGGPGGLCPTGERARALADEKAPLTRRGGGRISRSRVASSAPESSMRILFFVMVLLGAVTPAAAQDRAVTARLVDHGRMPRRDAQGLVRRIS